MSDDRRDGDRGAGQNDHSMNRSARTETVGHNTEKSPRRAKAMSQLSLKTKLGVGFGVLLLLMMTLGICGYRSSVTLDRLSDDVDRAAETKALAVMVEASIARQNDGVRG